MYLYNLLRIIAYIIILPFFLLSVKKRKFIAKRLFAKYKVESKKYWWFHMASMGEVNLSYDLIKKIADSNKNILLSVLTDTGMETAEKKYAKLENVKIIYFPLDDYWQIKKILKNIELEQLILIETEIWPNLINLCAKTAKISLVNGRISMKSLKRYKKLRFILKNILKKIDIFIMQTHIDKERIEVLGVDSKKIDVIGNLKFSIKLPGISKAQKNNLLKKISGGSDKIFVAGSTRSGEDEQILDVFREIKDYKLILVPRHLERVKEIEELIQKYNYKYTKWTNITEENATESKIVLVDAIGVLRDLYQISDVAFVGGTLVNVGGHSLLEPLYYEKFPIFGEYTQNVAEIAKEIEKRKIGYRVKNKKEFLDAIDGIEKQELDSKEIDLFFRENRDNLEKVYFKLCEAAR